MIKSMSVTRELVHVIGGAELTDVDITRIDATMLASPEYHPGICVLWDLTEVEKSLVHIWSLEVLVKMHRSKSELYRENKCAIATKKLELFGLARIYQHLASELPMQIALFADHTMLETGYKYRFRTMKIRSKYQERCYSISASVSSFPDLKLTVFRPTSICIAIITSDVRLLIEAM